MNRYSIITLIDITQTGIRHKDDTEEWWIKRNQQRNLDTLLQTIGLRAQPVDYHVECRESNLSYLVSIVGDYSSYNLSGDDDSLVRYWVIDFTTDLSDVFGPRCIHLVDDLHQVPIVSNLTENIPIFPPLFLTKGDNCNTWVLVH